MNRERARAVLFAVAAVASIATGVGRLIRGENGLGSAAILFGVAVGWAAVMPHGPRWVRALQYGLAGASVVVVLATVVTS